MRFFCSPLAIPDAPYQGRSQRSTSDSQPQQPAILRPLIQRAPLAVTATLSGLRLDRTVMESSHVHTPPFCSRHAANGSAFLPA